ncbi:hypothetical protein GUITHDRAFT_65920, partial [Guillardia theta CCMP2712]
VSCGGQHTCALNSSGELFSWGNNRYGQLGRSVSEGSEVMRDCFPMPVEMPKGVSVTMIACGDLHCVCIADIVSQDRSGLFSWGCGDNGRLGYPAGAHQPTPRLIEFDLHEDFVGVSCGSSHSAAITSKGHLYTWGSNESGQCGPFKLPALQDLKESQVITSISSRGFHACALTDDDKLLIWGKGVSGRLGLGNEVDQYVPIIIEFDGGSVPVKELSIKDEGIVVEAVFTEVPDGLKVGDRLKEVSYRTIGPEYSIAMVKELFNGPIDSVCRIVIERMVKDEDDLLGEEEQLKELVKYVRRVDWREIITEGG